MKIPDDSAHRKRVETLLQIERDLAVAFCSASDLDEALQSVLEAACKVEAIDGGGVYLVNTQTKCLELAAHKGLPSAYTQAVAKYEPDSPQARMVNEGKPLFGLHSQIAPVMDNARREAGLRALAVLPLKNDGAVIGALNVASRTHDELPSSTGNALEAIAAQAAGMIARLRAEEALRRSHTRLEERVKKRTAELEEANRRLGAEMAERGQIESALRVSEERFRSIFEEAPLGMVIIGTGGKCLQVNREICRILDREPSRIVGKFIADLGFSIGSQHNWDELQRVLAGEISCFTWETKLAKDNRETVWIRITATTVHDQNGKLLYGLGMMEDINQRKETEEALRRAERLASIGTLAAGIAHEINNPLSAIVLSADAALLASEQPRDGEIVEASLRNIQAGALRCGRIVKSVLQFSRNETSQKWLDDIGAVIRRARDIAKKMAADAGVAIRLEIDDDLPRIVINPTEIEQVLVNMMTNAVQASKPDNCVNVSVGRLSDNLIIVIEDNGVGMTKEQSERIFDPFYTTRQPTGGIGLGLSISHGIVQEHGGKIYFKSKPGAGTKMTVMLPISRR